MILNHVSHVLYTFALVAKTRKPEDKELCIAVHIL